MTEGRRLLASNRKARHTYHLLERETAGIELLGTEVKAIRAGKINIKEGYVAFADGEAFLVGCHIGAYDSAGYAGHDPLRRRRLLLHKREIRRLDGKIKERGYTLIPLKIYFKKGKAKVEIALAKGKKLWDKRETLKRKTLDREFEKKYKIR